MADARVLPARSRARAGVLAGVAAVTLLFSAFLTVVVGILLVAPTAGARDGLAAATGADRVERWQTRLADDATAQADAAGRVLDRFVAPHGATWSRSVQSAPVEAAGGGHGAVLLADPEAAGRSELVAGTWPDDPAAIAEAGTAGAAPASLHAAAAEATGLGPGSVVELDGARLLVVGTWLPRDAGAPGWAGDPIVATGGDADVAGPFLVDEPALVDVGAAVAVRWTVVAEPDGATEAQLGALRSALPAVTPALGNEPDVGTDGIIESGRLDATLGRLLAGLGAARALAPLPLLLLGVAGLVALARLAVLLVADRRRETTLLLARGASATSLTRWAAVEAFVVALPTSALGAAAGALALGIAAPLAAAQPAVPWLVAVGVAATVVAVLTGTAWRDAGRPVVRGAGDETGRARRALAAGGVVLLVATAAIALWQFRLYGSPLVPSASGATQVDPVAALAPVLVLLALAVGALAVTGGAGRLLERWAARGPGLVPALPARQLARRTPLYASAILVLAFATGGVALTAAVDGSWRAFDRSASAAELGGDVRVTLPGRGVVTGPDPFAGADASADVEGVGASAPVFRGEVRIGSDAAELVALPVTRLTAVARGAGSPLDAAVLDALAATPRGPGVEPGARLDLDVEVHSAASAAADGASDATGEGGAPGPSGRAAVAVWLLDADGAAVRLDSGSVAPGARTTVSATAPDLDGLTLLGVEVRLVGGAGDLAVAVREVAATPGGSLGLTGELAVSSTSPSARLAASGTAGSRVPVVIDERLAGRVDAEAGDPLEFRVQTGGAEVLADVETVVAVVPAGEPGVLADLGAITTSAFASGAGVPQHGELWLAASEPDAVADALEGDPTASVAVVSRADVSSARIVAPALAALWIGAAGSLLFALVALGGLVVALAGARSGETAVLRALGVTPRGQAAARRDELLGLAVVSIVVGIAIGAAAALVTAADLGRAAVPSASGGLAAVLEPSWSPLAIALAALLAGSVAIAAAAARAVRRDASVALPGTEDR